MSRHEAWGDGPEMQLPPQPKLVTLGHIRTCKWSRVSISIHSQPGVARCGPVWPRKEQSSAAQHHSQCRRSCSVGQRQQGAEALKEGQVGPQHPPDAGLLRETGALPLLRAHAPCATCSSAEVGRGKDRSPSRLSTSWLAPGRRLHSQFFSLSCVT